MTKAELINQIARDTGMTKHSAENAVNAFMGAVTIALRNGEDVTLQGFGTFSVKHREARVGRNPATGATLQVPASKTVGFKPGKALKDAVAG